MINGDFPNPAFSNPAINYMLFPTTNNNQINKIYYVPNNKVVYENYQSPIYINYQPYKIIPSNNTQIINPNPNQNYNYFYNINNNNNLINNALNNNIYINYQNNNNIINL